MSRTGIVALILYGVGLLLALLSLALPYWSSYGDGNGNWIDIGLWQFCLSGPNLEDVCPHWIDNTAYKENSEMAILGVTINLLTFKVTEAMESIGLIFAVVGLVGILLSVFMPMSKYNETCVKVGIIASGLAGLFTLVGVFIYGVVITQMLHVSFALALLAGLLYLCGGMLFVY